MPTATIETTYECEGVPFKDRRTLAGNSHVHVGPEPVVNGTPETFTFGVKEAGLKSLIITTDKAISCSFANGGTPDVIAVAANATYQWRAELGANPFSDDVVSVTVTSSTSGQTATINIWALVDN